MKTLVIYDSMYGNTEKIAQAIAGGLAGGGCTEVLHVSAVKLQEVTSANLLIVGSPTQGGRPTKDIYAFLHGLPSLKVTRVAAFDTRFDIHECSPGLRALMHAIGYAAGKIARSLSAKGGEIAAAPEGFIVTATNGPLRQGELERAAEWAATLRSAKDVMV